MLLSVMVFSASSIHASEVTGDISSSTSSNSQVEGSVNGDTGAGSTVSGTVGGNSGSNVSGTVGGTGNSIGGSVSSSSTSGGGSSSLGGTIQNNSTNGLVLGASDGTNTPSLPDTGFGPIEQTNSQSFGILSLGLLLALMVYGMYMFKWRKYPI